MFYFLATSLVLTLSLQVSIAELLKFHIVAPQIVCPKDENSPIEKPDSTIITIQTDSGVEFEMDWTVRWHPLPAPTQRFTLILWRTVRALEAKLNGLQPEPFVYVINDDELLYGVNYIFNVTAKVPGKEAVIRSFDINNTFGDQKLEKIKGLGDMLSVLLVGNQVTYADIDFIVEAEVTSCVPKHDYHFIWDVRSEDFSEKLNISTIGSRLEIPPYSLRAGVSYNAICCVISDTSNKIITQIELPFEVGYRGLEVNLNVDRLIVGIDRAFVIESTLNNHDYFGSPLTFEWRCSFNERSCDFFKSSNESNLILSSGLPTSGEYEITLFVSVFQQIAQASATIIAVDSILPVIMVQATPRLVNEGGGLSLVANVSDVAPTCKLVGYFATEEQLLSDIINESSVRHGEPITEIITVMSLEETFLFEITDFTNDTEWRHVTASTKALAGRARLVVECNCSLTFDCERRGVVYADVNFELNEGPKPGNITITPDTGTALETIFRISSHTALDSDKPLRYTFLCNIGNNDTLILRAKLDYLTLETLLPYEDGGTQVWVEVCDIFGACSNSESMVIPLQKGTGRTINVLMDYSRAHIRRCELIALQTVTVSAIITYNNAGQTELLTIFTAFLLDSLPTLPASCISENHDQYLRFLNKLYNFGFDTSSLV